MGRFFIAVFLTVLASSLFGQGLRTSPLQYQFSALALNPAYASRLSYPGIEATYFGNFTAGNQVSRSVLVNMQKPTYAGGIGGTFQFYRTFFFGEANIRPAYAWRFGLADGSEISFGVNVGFNYFDIDETVVSSIQSDFFSIDGGVGVYYHLRNSYVGLSVNNLYENSFGFDESQGDDDLARENPYSLIGGTMFRLTDDIYLRPSIWLQVINIYELPEHPFSNVSQDLSGDLMVSAVVEETYVIGLLAGKRDVEFGDDIARFGVSASFIFGGLRLTYALQSNNYIGSKVSLPESHLFSVGLDFFPLDEEVPVRYF